MINGHLPAHLGWIAYKFILWPGIHYGLATLATPLTIARATLQKENFRILPILGINRNVKQEWRTLHRTFGGIRLFDLAVEHTIGIINIFVQHYGAGTTVGLKYSALLEALQLEFGCTGNPLKEDYDRYHWLATNNWVKCFWERLHFYRFRIHLEYVQLPLPCRNNTTLIGMFWQAGYKTQQLQALNRCRLAHQPIFLSDMALACGQYIDLLLLQPPPLNPAKHCSSYNFPNCYPSQNDCKLWLDIWMSTTGNSGLLHIPLAEWLYPSHRMWQWYYYKYNNILYHKGEEGDNANTTFVRTDAHARTRSQHEYYQGEDIDIIQGHCVPAQVLPSAGGTIIRRSLGPPLATLPTQLVSFWDHLRSLGGECMWDDVQGGKSDVAWIGAALCKGSFIGVTDGSYNREQAKTVSGLGWTICCIRTRNPL
jgi:hypothetical protein